MPKSDDHQSPKPKTRQRRPNLENLKKRARTLLEQLRDGDETATARLQKHHPRLATVEPKLRRIALADAQLILAREHGATSWSDLKRWLENHTLFETLELLPLGKQCIYPHVELDLQLHAEHTLAIAARAHHKGSKLACFAQARPEPAAHPTELNSAALHSIGVIAEVIDLDDRGQARLRCGGRIRLRASSQQSDDGGPRRVAQIELLPETVDSPTTRLKNKIEYVARELGEVPRRALEEVREGTSPGRLVTIGAGLCPFEARLELLEVDGLDARTRKLCDQLDEVLRERRTEVAPHPPHADAWIVVMYSEQFPHLAGRRFAVWDGLDIGRGSDNDVCLPSHHVSRTHCRIERHDGTSYRLRDPGSTNGTFVDGAVEPTREVELHDGAKIDVGDCVLAFACGPRATVSSLELCAELHTQDVPTALLCASEFFRRLDREVIQARATARVAGNGTSAGGCLAVVVLEVSAIEPGGDQPAKSQSLEHRRGGTVARQIHRACAQRLVRALPQDHLSAHLGGGRYAVAHAAIDDVHAFAEPLQRALAASPVETVDGAIRLRCNAGTARLTLHNGSSDLATEAEVRLERNQSRS